MAEIQGIVLRVNGERAEVKVDREASEASHLPKNLDCWNPIGAKVGNIVGAEYRALEEWKAKAILYGCPVFGFLAGAAFGYAQAKFFDLEGWHNWAMIAGGIVLFEIVSLSYARIFKRDAMREGIQPVIYEIHVEEMVIDMGKK